MTHVLVRGSTVPTRSVVKARSQKSSGSGYMGDPDQSLGRTPRSWWANQRLLSRARRIGPSRTPSLVVGRRVTRRSHPDTARPTTPSTPTLLCAHQAESRPLRPHQLLAGRLVPEPSGPERHLVPGVRHLALEAEHGGASAAPLHQCLTARAVVAQCSARVIVRPGRRSPPGGRRSDRAHGPEPRHQRLPGRPESQRAPAGTPCNRVLHRSAACAGRSSLESTLD